MKFSDVVRRLEATDSDTDFVAVMAGREVEVLEVSFDPELNRVVVELSAEGIELL